MIAVAQYAVWGYLCLVPWTVMFLPRLDGHDYARMLQVLVCGICGIAVALRLLLNGSNPIPSRRNLGGLGIYSFWLVAVVFLSLASTILAPVISRASQELTLVICLVSLVVIQSKQAGATDVRLSGQVIVVSTLLYSGLVFSVLCIGMVNGFPPNIEELGLGYVNRRFFNHVQTVALPLLAMVIHCQSISARWRAAAWISLAIGFALLLLSGGRGTFVGILGAMLLAPLWMGRSIWSCIRPLIVGFLAGLAIYFGLFVQLSSSLGLTSGVGLIDRAQDGGSVSARLYLWRLAGNFAIEAPWLGIGPMHFAHIIHLDATHPHNIYLQVMAEWGIPMLGLLLMGGGTALYVFAQIVRKTEDCHEKCVGGSLLIACVAVLLDGVFSGNFVMPVSQVWIAMCVGLAARWVHSHSSPPMQTAARGGFGGWVSMLFASIFIVGSCVQVILLFRDIASLDFVLSRATDLSVNFYMSPRFWSNGWF